jgi:hypothetical protein
MVGASKDHLYTPFILTVPFDSSLEDAMARVLEPYKQYLGVFSIKTFEYTETGSPLISMRCGVTGCLFEIKCSILG